MVLIVKLLMCKNVFGQTWNTPADAWTNTDTSAASIGGYNTDGSVTNMRDGAAVFK